MVPGDREASGVAARGALRVAPCPAAAARAARRPRSSARSRPRSSSTRRRSRSWPTARHPLGLRHHEYQDAIDNFQDIIDNYPYSELRGAVANLEIADTYFARERYEEALSYYRDFAELHPDHARVPYALHRAALCHYRQSRDPGRDQTATKLARGPARGPDARFPDTPEAPRARCCGASCARGSGTT